jgi:hypothetical protein
MEPGSRSVGEPADPGRPLEERRTWPRFRVLPHLAWIAWGEGADFRVCQATLMNLGHGGASIIADDLPGNERPVRLGLGPHLTIGESAAAGGIESVTLSSSPIRSPRGGASVRYEIHLSFRERCPTTLYRDLIHGGIKPQAQRWQDLSDEPDPVQYAFGLLVAWMRDEGQPPALRLDCAREFLSLTRATPPPVPPSG